jgi:hypothetical protein
MVAHDEALVAAPGVELVVDPHDCSEEDPCAAHQTPPPSASHASATITKMTTATMGR